MTAPLILTRLLDAPRERVFQAFTDPDHLQKWWGPESFSNPRCEWDATPGGALRVDMRGPDGAIHPMGGEVLESVPPERLIFVTWPLDAAGRRLFELHLLLVLEADGPHTRLHLRAEPRNLGPEAAPYLAGMAQGWDQSLLRLEALVCEPLSDREMVAIRYLNARPAEVRAAWVDPERLAHWWGPAGFTNTFDCCEPWPGGAWRFTMHGPNGENYPNECRFREVEADRVVVEHVVPPFFTLSTVFTPEGEGTRIVWRQAFADSATCRQLRPFVLQPNEENLTRLAENIAAHR